MSILTHNEIISNIEKKIITIDPFDSKKVGPASYECTLGSTFRVFKNLHETIDLKSENFDVEFFSEEKIVTNSITLHSGQTLLGVTNEKITLPKYICGWIQGRSRFARLGLMIHISSSFIQPDTKGIIVLELFNAGPMSISIHPGLSICQIIFEETKGKATYSGKFQNQLKP